MYTRLRITYPCVPSTRELTLIEYYSHRSVIDAEHNTVNCFHRSHYVVWSWSPSVGVECLSGRSQLQTKWITVTVIYQPNEDVSENDCYECIYSICVVIMTRRDLLLLFDDDVDGGGDRFRRTNWRHCEAAADVAVRKTRVTKTV